jgi:hypothetical protein
MIKLIKIKRKMRNGSEKRPKSGKNLKKNIVVATGDMPILAKVSPPAG